MMFIKKIKKIMTSYFSLFTAFILVFQLTGVVAADDMIELKYRLKWLYNASVAGDIYALDHGIFKEAGLDVQVKEGGPEKDAIKELELGQAQFGVASADQVIRARDKGAKVVVIAQLFQINPLHWIYRTDKPEIKTLGDLKGRSVGITYGGNDETIMKTLLAKAGLNESDLKLTSVRFDFTPFFKREVEVWPCYINSQGVFLKDKLAAEGEDVRFFSPAEFGVNFVANSVVTSEKMMNEQKKTVQTFLEALMKGWEASMDPGNEANTLATIKKFDKDSNDDNRKKQLTSTRSLVKPSLKIKVGTIDVASWKQTEEIMLDQMQIKKAVEIGNYLIINE